MSKKSRRPGRVTRHQRPPYRPDPAAVGSCCPICDAMGIEINDQGEIVNLGQQVEITIDVQDLGGQWRVDGGWQIQDPGGHWGIAGGGAMGAAMIDIGAIRAASRWLAEMLAEMEASAREAT